MKNPRLLFALVAPALALAAALAALAGPLPAALSVAASSAAGWLVLRALRDDERRGGSGGADPDAPPPLTRRVEVSPVPPEEISALPSTTALAAARAGAAEPPFLVRLLATLSIPFEEWELVQHVLAAFSARTGALAARIAVCDRPDGEPVYQKDSRGRFEKRPALDRLASGDAVEWRIALPLAGATVGWLTLTGGTPPEEGGGEFETAAAIAALALLSARHRTLDARPGLTDAQVRDLTLRAGRAACGIMVALGEADRALFLHRAGGRGGAYDPAGTLPDAEEAERLLARMAALSRERGDELAALDGPLHVGGIAYAAAAAVCLNRGRDEGFAAFLCLRREGAFPYRALQSIRLTADLAGRLFGEAADKARIERVESRRRLLSDFTLRVAAALESPDRIEPLDELLALVSPALPARLLALVPDDERLPPPCSQGETGRAALLRFLGETNTRLWLRDARGALDLRDIGPCREPAERFLSALGADPATASLAALGRDGGPHLLVVADERAHPLPLPDERLEKTLLDFARTLTEAAADRARRDRDRLEREKLERLAAIGEMAAGVAHEIRNPLGGIELYATSLLSAETDGRKRKWLESITGAVRKLNRIVGDLLLFAREERMELRPVELRAALSECAAILSAERVSAGAALELPPPASAPAQEPVALADPVRLGQILLNVLRNALEAAGEGGRVRASVSLDGPRALLRVEDDGPGVPPELSRRIFDPFFTTRSTGTGLGLPISLKLAERMGGTLALAPSSLGGAAFELALRRPEVA